MLEKRFLEAGLPITSGILERAQDTFKALAADRLPNGAHRALSADRILKRRAINSATGGPFQLAVPFAIGGAAAMGSNEDMDPVAQMALQRFMNGGN